MRGDNSQEEISEVARDHGIASKGHVEGLSWKGGWIIYAERGKKGTVELGLEKCQIVCSTDIHTLVLILSTTLPKSYFLSLFST